MSSEVENKEFAIEQWKQGEAAAREALERSDHALCFADEMGDSYPDAFAMGWNSVCASEENHQRIKKLSEKTGHFQE